MIFQRRDREILKWVHGHGFVTVSQIQKMIGVGKTAAYVRVKKLVDAGYLRRQRIFHGAERVHIVTRKGLQTIEDTLPYLANISLGTFHHNLLLVDLALDLERKTGGYFVSERRVRQELANQTGRVPDAILRLPNNHNIAIELELSVKSKARLSHIVKSYMTNFDYYEVWYFTNSPHVERALQRALPNNSHIKLNPIHIEEILYE